MSAATFSLRKRLRNTSALLLTSVMAILWLFDQFALRQLAEVFVVADLEHDIETVAAAWSPDEGLDFTRLPPVYIDDRSGHYFVLDAQGHEYRSGGLARGELAGIPAAGSTGRKERRIGPRGKELLVFAKDVVAPSGVVLSLIVAEPIEHLNESLHSMMLVHGGVALGALVVFMVLGHWMVNWALGSLEALRNSLAAMQQGHPAKLDPAAVPVEVSPLVEELVRLQAAHEARLARARNTVADLAHGLKTPLAAVARMSRAEEPIDPRTLGDLRDRMERQIEHAVGRARLAGDVAPNRRSSPARDLPDLVEVMRRAHGERIQFRIEPLPDIAIDVDREDLLEFMGNLLDNGAKWARSVVLLSVTLTDDQVCLVVEDDGPGFDGGQAQLVRRRGVRGDMVVPGEGLGLAIVAEGVELYDGSLIIGKSETLGGARVALGFRRRR
jgi:signal transduction histidine kinase